MKKRIYLIFLLTLFLFIISSFAVSATVPGVDVSHWQGSINWQNVYSAGQRFSFAKATEGTSFTDSQFSTNMVNGKNAGMLMGAYHFARPDVNSDAAAEARYFVTQAKPYLNIDYLRPALD